MKIANKMVVIDLEMTCWENEPPADESSEIIEIGYCVVDLANLTREDPVSMKVKPARSKVSEYCTNLTGWTERELRSGQPFADACKTLIYKKGFRRMAWASWGRSDLEAMEREVEIVGAEYPLSDTYFDLSAMYSLVFGQPIKTSQENALKSLSLPQEGRKHLGADDAYNAAGILLKIVQKCRIGDIK